MTEENVTDELRALSPWRLGNATRYDERVEFERKTISWIAPDYLSVRLAEILKLEKGHPQRRELRSTRKAMSELAEEPVPKQLPDFAAKYLYNILQYNMALRRCKSFLSATNADTCDVASLTKHYTTSIKSGDLRTWLAIETILQTRLLCFTLRMLETSSQNAPRLHYELVNRCYFVGQLHDRWIAFTELSGATPYEIVTGIFRDSITVIRAEAKRTRSKLNSAADRKEYYRSLYLDRCLPGATTQKAALVEFAVLVGIFGNEDPSQNAKHPDKAARMRLIRVFPEGIPKPKKG